MIIRVAELVVKTVTDPRLGRPCRRRVRNQGLVVLLSVNLASSELKCSSLTSHLWRNWPITPTR
jgi:hypothetical protein